MVGSTMAMDLATDFDVTVADRDPAALADLATRYGVGIEQADLASPAEIHRLAADHDIVIGALSSRMGLATLRAVIEARRNYVDISFMADDATQLDGLAREHGVTAVVDCGVGPGLSNLTAGYAVEQMSPCRKLEIYVGGLPAVRTWPYGYKAPFAASDVIEEYTRPARIVEKGKIVVREALSEPELIDFPGVGTLEAFNTDGLRSLATTLDVPDMIEKTMRYPGHIELMRVLRHTGFFSEEPIEVDGAQVVPLALTSKLLFPKWEYADGETDITVMRVIAHGDHAGRSVRWTWDLHDRRDAVSGCSSMSRTTGFPATIMARMVSGGQFVEPGVHPPEVCGARDGLFDAVVAQLKTRGIDYTFTETVVG